MSKKLIDESGCSEHLTAKQIHNYDRTWSNSPERRGRGMQQIKQRLFDRFWIIFWSIMGLLTLGMIIAAFAAVMVL